MIGIVLLFRSYFLRIGSVARSMLLEIFEESAYARFLERRRIATSTQAYGDFLRETQAHRERRPRCC